MLSALRAAAATVHRDERWWLKCLGYGAAALSGVGLPLAAGFVMESLDNSRRGFPTPLPPWADPSLRWLTGLFALLIDFAFFLLPIVVVGLLGICASLALALGAPGGDGQALAVLFGSVGGVAGCLVLALFLASVAPAGRLRFAREGRIEEALSIDTLRWALGHPQRAQLLRARLASLPAYLPALLIALLCLFAARFSFVGQFMLLALGFWLLLAALVYAHLVVVQLYVEAERALQRQRMGM
jgi:hypothetical protein